MACSHFFMSALTGSELLAKVKQLEAEGYGKNELARQTGYVSTKKDGGEKIDRSAFFEALLAAKGVILEGSGSPGRKLTFQTKVQFNGNLMIGSAYTKQAGFNPGDEFQIVVNRKGFTLKPTQSSGQCPDGACPTSEDQPDFPDDDEDVALTNGVDSETTPLEEVES
jgi:hypothetical protein